MRDLPCSRHYSYVADRPHCNWVKQSILFHAVTTMVHTHVLNRGEKGVRSPIDAL